MIPWNFLTQIRSDAQRICGAKVRLMFGTPTESCPAAVLGIFFHEPDSLTLQLNDQMRGELQLSMLEVQGSSTLMLHVADRMRCAHQRLVLWRSGDSHLNVSIHRLSASRLLPSVAERVDTVCRASAITPAASADRMSYLLILSAKLPSGERRRRAYYTTTCLTSPETEWAKQEFHSKYPETVGMRVKEEFHSSFDVLHFGTRTSSGEWWVYVDSAPRVVNSEDAVALYRANKITHVCRKNEERWLTPAQAGLL